jgi:hypothetical protein
MKDKAQNIVLYTSLIIIVVSLFGIFSETTKLLDRKTEYLMPLIEGTDFSTLENCKHIESGVYICTDNSEYSLEELLKGREVEENMQIPNNDIKKTVYTGKASYYWLGGCIGCRDDRIMANGEPLDDTKLTVAFNRAPLNSYVKVCNVNNELCIEAKVTDTGGFEDLGRIIDLGLSTKNSIRCFDLCDVSVELIEDNG